MDFAPLLLGALLGAFFPLVALFMQRRHQERVLAEQDARAKLLLEAAQEKASAAAREAEVRGRSELLKQKERLEQEYDERFRDLNEQKRRLDKKDEHLEHKVEQMDRRERDLDQRRNGLEEERHKLAGEQAHYTALTRQVMERLEQVAQLTTEQAKEELKALVMEEARRESGRFLKQVEEETREMAEKRAHELVTTAIQRYAGELVAERTVSVVALPSEEMKGRIIGREGRNIRALEAATGCDLIIDDTPEAVVISGFHPVRRQVARRTLEELITDGRIHPARIEEVAKKNLKLVNNEIREAGERAVYDVGLHNVHPELVRLLGTLKFRTSYTQNVLQHAVEVAYFAGMMAEELGLDGKVARRCGLLHDIGKAVDHEMEGSHAILGGQFAKKYKEDPVVVNAISAHHFEVEPTTVYAALTNAADALSAARPGARRETMETYVRRLDDLERIATNFSGVDKAYAIQAGRELRVMVSYDKVNDEGSMLLAREIARKVEEEMSYPGQIKVTVIREMRTTEIAH